MSPRTLDGIVRQPNEQEEFFGETKQSRPKFSLPKLPKFSFKPPKLKHGFILGIITIILIGVLLVAGWAQPILAAMPMKKWSDQKQFIQLLKPGVYLVLFQNQRELRPTGGFLGTFAEIEVGWGLQIKSIKVDSNIYQRDQKYAAQLNIEPPEALRTFIGNSPWAMRDSNWDYDFPTAAQNVAWFYQQEGGRPVDGVIAIDGRLLERMLNLTGPIDLPKQGKKIQSSNAMDVLENVVEKDYWQSDSNIQINQPKSVMADLLPELIKRIKSLNPVVLINSLKDAFSSKEILFYERDADLGKVLRSIDWDGAINVVTENDYLNINEANLSTVDNSTRLFGSKSSWSINRQTKLTRTVSDDGSSIVHTLEMGRLHGGKNQWPDGPNQSYLRVIVPSGATLISAERNGQTIVSDVRLEQGHNLTTYGFWDKLNPGDHEVITLKYSVPSVSIKPLVIDRQAGMPAYPFEVWDAAEMVWKGDLSQDIVLK